LENLLLHFGWSSWVCTVDSFDPDHVHFEIRFFVLSVGKYYFPSIGWYRMTSRRYTGRPITSYEGLN
jgi:hypothetical protein